MHHNVNNTNITAIILTIDGILLQYILTMYGQFAYRWQIFRYSVTDIPWW